MGKIKEEKTGLLSNSLRVKNRKRNQIKFFMKAKTSKYSNRKSTEFESSSEEDELEDDDEQCGWLCYKPDYLQCFRKVSWAMLFLTLGALNQGIAINGLLHYVIATIERRFNLRSTESGIVSGSYDFASLILLIPVTFFGGRPKSSKPKWVGFGLILLGIGSLIFTLPYFLAPQMQVESEQNFYLCNYTSGTTSLECSKSRDENLSKYMWVFMVGNLLHGAGGTPLYTLAVSYIDENVTRKRFGFYTGIFYSAATLGTALGYIYGGYLLELHEDFLRIDVSQLGLTPESKAWVGAWWIGFILCALLFFIFAIPLIGLPAKLPDWELVKSLRVSEHVITIDRTKAYEHFSELPKAMCELFQNSSFVFLNLAACCEGIIISGSGAFMPKIIQTQFHISSKATASIMGIVTVPSAVMGTLMGGGIIRKFDLKFKGILKLCVCTTLLAMICASGFFFVCPNEEFAGVNVPYTNENNLFVNHSCNVDCNCKWNEYRPTCGINNVLYFSPCHAGCTSAVSVTDKIMNYYNCSCVNDRNSSFEATNRSCKFPCPNLPHFLILLYLTLFFTFVAAMPLINATLRCVKHDQNSLAMGTQWMIVRLGGMVPGPILFGALIDDACTHWLRTCETGKGSCFMYDHFLLSRYMVLLAYGWKSLEIAFFLLSIWSYNRSLRVLEAAAENIRLQ